MSGEWWTPDQFEDAAYAIERWWTGDNESAWIEPGSREEAEALARVVLNTIELPPCPEPLPDDEAVQIVAERLYHLDLGESG